MNKRDYLTFHPMLFQPRLVRALLNTAVNSWPPHPIDATQPFKWQTRRPLKNQPVSVEYYRDGQRVSDSSGAASLRDKNGRGWTPTIWPKSRALPEGFVIYVREGFLKAGDQLLFRADFTSKEAERLNIKWTPGIHMPKELARIHLQIMRVRCERVRDINWQDAIAEGSPDVMSFLSSWSEIYPASLEWCWVYDLKRIK